MHLWCCQLQSVSFWMWGNEGPSVLIRLYNWMQRKAIQNKIATNQQSGKLPCATWVQWLCAADMVWCSWSCCCHTIINLATITTYSAFALLGVCSHYECDSWYKASLLQGISVTYSRYAAGMGGYQKEGTCTQKWRPTRASFFIGSLAFGHCCEVVPVRIHQNRGVSVSNVTTAVGTVYLWTTHLLLTPYITATIVCMFGGNRYWWVWVSRDARHLSVALEVSLLVHWQVEPHVGYFCSGRSVLHLHEG